MVLSQLNFENGYISSDSFDHEICQKLIEKYHLIPIYNDVVETIMFGNTCKYIILTSGTMSWFIGVFAWFSKIYYPNHDLRPKYGPDIYNFSDWTMVNYDDKYYDPENPERTGS
jgi:hypothetical protein